jgi:predicted nucleotide-binding protein
LRIARKIRELRPDIRLIGMSFFADDEIHGWFAEYGHAFLPKSWLLKGASTDFIDVIEHAVKKRHRKRKPRAFIVHGHDTRALHELAYFIRSSLKWPHPVILRELPSKGRTIIEKLEEATEKIDIAFVLLTADDKAAPVNAPDEIKRRSRQNVIFELGYLFAKLQRIGGRVILLHQGEIEIPSDITGICYVDISKGIEAAGEAVRRELGPWLR